MSELLEMIQIFRQVGHRLCYFSASVSANDYQKKEKPDQWGEQNTLDAIWGMENV